MITIVTVDEEILEKAARLAGIRDKTALVHKSLGSLIAGESAKRLAALGGTEKGLRRVPRHGEASERSGAGGGPEPCSAIHEGGAAADGGHIADGGGNGR